jgi:Flp pilus assembly protein TadG
MKRVFKFFLRLARCTSGSAALLEATLIVPPTVALMVGVVDFSVALTTEATAGKSVRDAARYLASLPAIAVCPSSGTGWGVSNAQNLAVYGNIAGTGNPLISGWSPSDVQVTYSAGCTNSPPEPFNITVTATFPYTPFMAARLVGVSGGTKHAIYEEASLAWFE